MATAQCLCPWPLPVGHTLRQATNKHLAMACCCCLLPLPVAIACCCCLLPLPPSSCEVTYSRIGPSKSGNGWGSSCELPYSRQGPSESGVGKGTCYCLSLPAGPLSLPAVSLTMSEKALLGHHSAHLFLFLRYTATVGWPDLSRAGQKHATNQLPLAMQESGVVVLMGGSGGGEGAPAPNELRVWPRTLVTGGGWWMEW